jgi:predicted patatin/cPLA2 family phospholipase
MKCAYAAGALVALAKKLGVTAPDIFISASGSVAAMFYYLAGQYDDIERMWLRYMPSPEIVSLVPPRLNIDYIIDTILRRELPLDIDAFSGTKTKWFVPVTELETGHTRFISNETWFDPYEVMRAAKAIPFLYGGAVRLGAKPYVDGGMNINMAELIRKAHEEGATKILCFSNTTFPSKSAEWFTRTYAAFAPPMLRQLVLRDMTRAQWDHMPGGVEVFVIGPSYPLPIGLFSKVRRKVAEAYQMGHDDLMDKQAAVKNLFGI